MLLQIAFDPNLFERGMITSVANHTKVLYEELLVAAARAEAASGLMSWMVLGHTVAQDLGNGVQVSEHSSWTIRTTSIPHSTLQVPRTKKSLEDTLSVKQVKLTQACGI